MTKNQIIGVLLGFILGLINYVVIISPWIFRGNLTKPEELFAFWTFCLLFVGLFYFIDNLKRIIVLAIALALLPLIFYVYQGNQISQKMQEIQKMNQEAFSQEDAK